MPQSIDGMGGERPTWDEYFLDIAERVSRRSPDRHTKHGCVLVDPDRRVISTGYNGPVSGLDHDLVAFDRPAKYDWLIHAEDNAVAFARCDLRGATAYVTGTPCAACFRRLLQVGVRRIVQGERESACLTDREREACETMARALRVEWVELAPARTNGARSMAPAAQQSVPRASGSSAPTDRARA